MGTLRFFEEVVSFKIRRTFGFADYRRGGRANGCGFFPLPLLFREGPGAKYLPLSYR